MARAEYTPGRFVWHELFSSDIERSRSFYRGLFGWTVDLVRVAGLEYHLVDADGVKVAGMMPLSALGPRGGRDRVDAAPFWLGYVSVPDVDAAAEAAVRTGGRVLAGPLDAGTLGRTVRLADPHGAPVAAWRSNEGDAPDTPPEVGQFTWHQLATSAEDADAPFYEAAFGWKRELFRAGPDALIVFRRSPASSPARWSPPRRRPAGSRS
jgi:hypothetical protein